MNREPVNLKNKRLYIDKINQFFIIEYRGKRIKQIMENNESIWQLIMDFFSGKVTPEKLRRRKLKQINKELMHLHYKFYMHKTSTMTTQFAVTMYDIYKHTLNLMNVLNMQRRNATIKTVLIESMLTEKQRELKDKLQEENIKKILTESLPNLKVKIQEINAQLKELVNSFDTKEIKEIDQTYNQIADISGIINFDYFFLLRKFDSDLTGKESTYVPQFEPIDAKYVLDDIKVYNDLLLTIKLEVPWDRVIKVANAINETFDHTHDLKKLVHYLKILKKNDYLTMVIQLLDSDPEYKPKAYPSNVKVVNEMLLKIQTDVNLTIEKIIRSIKKQKENSLLSQIFNTTVISRLKHYNLGLNESIQKKMITGFLYVSPMNYLKAFLLDIYKADMKPRFDQLIVHGNWCTVDASNNLAESSTILLKISDQILQFDNECGEDKKIGRDIKKYIHMADHDPNSKNLFKRVINIANTEASKILLSALQHFIILAQELKRFIDDSKHKSTSIIINYHTIKWEWGNITEDLIEIYKKIYNFVQLLKFHVKIPKKEEKKNKEAALEGNIL